MLTGSLSGTDLNLSGVLTAGTLNVGGLSSSGALFAPYFSATSTTATSTFAGGLTAANSSFNILQNGNVGIGTASPNVMTANLNSRVLSISGDGTLWNANGRLELINPRTAGSLAAGDDAGRIAWTMSNNGGGAAVNVDIGEISAVLDGVAGASGFGGKLQFRTKGNNDSFTSTRVVIDNSGNVGIGTTTPATTLSVAGSGYFTGGIGAGLLNTTPGSIAASGLISTPLYMVSSGTDTALSGFVVNSSALTIDTDKTVPYHGIAWKTFSDAPAGLSLYMQGYQGIRSYTNGLERMRITSSGNVGIGTTSPGAKLHVYGSGGADFPLIVQNDFTGVGASADLELRNGTAVHDSLRMLALGQGFTTDGAFTQDAGVISAESFLSGGLNLLTRANAPIRFYTNGHGNERMRITEGGNIGIGTTTPASKLHIADSSYNYQLLLDNTIVSGSSVMGFSAGGATKAAIGIAGAANGLLTGSASGDLVVRSNTGANSILFSANGSTPHMAVTSTGNVGIGTTTPTYKLTIAGTNTAGVRRQGL